MIEGERVSWRKILTRSHAPGPTIIPRAARCSSSVWNCSRANSAAKNAVCLTFKNISKVTLTALEIHFKCKGVDGIILCEDAFEYREIEVKPGESFGMDDAVFVTQKAITSVDVVLKNVYSGKKVVHLDAIKRVRLLRPRAA